MGAQGVEFVRDRFLTTRYLRDYLSIFKQLSDGARADEAPEAAHNVRL
jgi:hypothetical protein